MVTLVWPPDSDYDMRFGKITAAKSVNCGKHPAEHHQDEHYAK